MEFDPQTVGWLQNLTSTLVGAAVGFLGSWYATRTGFRQEARAERIRWRRERLEELMTLATETTMTQSVSALDQIAADKLDVTLFTHITRISVLTVVYLPEQSKLAEELGAVTGEFAPKVMEVKAAIKAKNAPLAQELADAVGQTLLRIYGITMRIGEAAGRQLAADLQIRQPQG